MVINLLTANYMQEYVLNLIYQGCKTPALSLAHWCTGCWICSKWIHCGKNSIPLLIWNVIGVKLSDYVCSMCGFSVLFCNCCLTWCHVSPSVINFFYHYFWFISIEQCIRCNKKIRIKIFLLWFHGRCHIEQIDVRLLNRTQDRNDVSTWN